MFFKPKGTVYSIQQINVILKELKAKYNIKIDYFQLPQPTQNLWACSLQQFRK